VLRRVSNTDVTLTAIHLVSTWTDRSFQATTYRRGRVLLAGDAAHIHSPLGGQGLRAHPSRAPVGFVPIRGAWRRHGSSR
jgi:2-polyprenyl-6-methoxyphenol hydroxylase-like FAD-dependent oxidoreductase